MCFILVSYLLILLFWSFISILWVKLVYSDNFLKKYVNSRPLVIQDWWSRVGLNRVPNTDSSQLLPLHHWGFLWFTIAFIYIYLTQMRLHLSHSHNPEYSYDLSHHYEHRLSPLKNLFLSSIHTHLAGSATAATTTIGLSVWNS